MTESLQLSVSGFDLMRASGVRATRIQALAAPSPALAGYIEMCQ